jgi:MGT family glycosyltransferase
MGIAHALRSKGHSVAFYTGEQMRTLVENEGFNFFPFRHLDAYNSLDSAPDIEPEGRKPRNSARRVGRALRQWLVETIPDQVLDLEPIIEEWCPDVIATDLSMWSTIVILWEKTGIPVVLSSTFMGPLIPGPDVPPWGLGLAPPRTFSSRVVARSVSVIMRLFGISLRRRLDALRAQHGLRPLHCTVDEFTARLPLYLVGNIPELDYNRHDLPDSVAYVGPCVWNRPSGAESPVWLDALPADQPWVHVTSSTVQIGDPFLLRAAVQGLANRPYQVILTTGKHRDPRTLDLGPIAPNITIHQWVSHADLLERCAVVVTNGGPATIMAALQVGVPLVIVPTTADKPDNARRVVEAGVGVMLSPRRCNPERLRAAVEEVLNHPGYRKRAAEIAQRLAATPGPERAAELLVNLVAPASPRSG